MITLILTGFLTVNRNSGFDTLFNNSCIFMQSKLQNIFRHVKKNQSNFVTMHNSRNISINHTHKIKGMEDQKYPLIIFRNK